MSAPVKIFVISLMRSTERRASITRQFREAGLTFEFIDGVDGKALSSEYIRENVNQERYNFWSELRHPGAIGCALSHRTAYQRMVDEKIPAAVVLEDDIALSPNFAQVLPKLAATVKDEEVILMFFHSAEKITLSDRDKLDVSHNYSLYNIIDYIYFGSAAGYLLTLNTAANLLNIQKPIFTIADDWTHFCKLKAMESFRLVVPFLVEPAGFKSTIGYTDTTTLWGKALGVIDKYQVFPFEQILRFVRKRTARKRQMYVIK